MPACVCRRPASATLARRWSWKRRSSVVMPDSRARLASIRSSGRGRLPAWLVRMRSAVCFIARPPNESGAQAVKAARVVGVYSIHGCHALDGGCHALDGGDVEVTWGSVTSNSRESRLGGEPPDEY